MKYDPAYIVMLTYNDLTVENAFETFDSCKNTAAKCFGIKEEPLSLYEMKKIISYMKECGKTTFIEIVRYDEEGAFEGTQKAVQCGCDYLMGTVYSDKINDLCLEHGIKYLPFIGELSGRPSVLKGSIEYIIEEANKLFKKGIFGFDLLGYRYEGDAKCLVERFVNEVSAPVCVAGSINSYERLEEINAISPWGYTMGSALFDNCFGNGFSEQIENVCNYMKKLRRAAK